MDQKVNLRHRVSRFLATPLRTMLLYLLIGYSWILLSDRLLTLLVADTETLVALQTAKGWAYVTVTGLLLYWLVRVATEQQQASQANLRAIFENTLQAFLLVDRQQRVQAFNRVANRLAQTTLHRDLEAGVHLRHVFNQEFYQNFRARFDRAIRGEAITAETSAPTPDGEEIWFQVNYNPVQTEVGEVVGLSLSVMDITARKVAEQELEARNAELEARNAELERFNYTVSHDLRSPLISIKGVLGLLEADIAADDGVQVAQDVADIRRAANQMEALLNDLLQLSRIGRVSQLATAVDMSALAQRAVDLLRPQIEARGVTVTVAPEMPVVVAEETRLLAVWQNLLENAIRFMGDQPAPRVEMGVEQSRSAPAFFVRDNGIGIAPQYRQKIFGLFEQLDAGGDGTGIGLAIVARIIDTHKGELWVESTPGQGSTFYFTLPQEGVEQSEDAIDE